MAESKRTEYSYPFPNVIMKMIVASIDKDIAKYKQQLSSKKCYIGIDLAHGKVMPAYEKGKDVISDNHYFIP